MSATADSRGGALIVAADRDDRRVLFDALDAQAFEEIYSARDIPQARGFLSPEIAIDLVVLEFGDDPREAIHGVLVPMDRLQQLLQLRRRRLHLRELRRELIHRARRFVALRLIPRHRVVKRRPA